MLMIRLTSESSGGAGAQVLVNADLVRVVEMLRGSGGGSKIVFDQEHSMVVTESPDEIEALIDEQFGEDEEEYEDE